MPAPREMTLTGIKKHVHVLEGAGLVTTEKVGRVRQCHVAVETVQLEDLGDGRTKVVNTSLFHTTEERDGMLSSGMEEGLNQSYAALDALLAK